MEKTSGGPKWQTVGKDFIQNRLKAHLESMQKHSSRQFRYAEYTDATTDERIIRVIPVKE